MNNVDATQWDSESFRESNRLLTDAGKKVHGEGMFADIKQRLAEANVQGRDRITTVDKGYAWTEILGRDYRREFVKQGVADEINILAPEMRDLLHKTYGESWHETVDEPVLRNLWELRVEINKQIEHGHRLNHELKEKYWNNRSVNEQGEQIFLPESPQQRRELLGTAKYFDQARVEARVAMVKTVNAIAEQKGYTFASPEAQGMRDALLTQWSQEEAKRAANCVYESTELGFRLKMSQVNERIAQGDIPELETVAERIWDVVEIEKYDFDSLSKSRRTQLLQKAGILAGSKTLTLREGWSGARALLTGRMLRADLNEIVDKSWEEPTKAGTYIDADIHFLNMLGLESAAKMESAGREIIVGEIYQAKAHWLADKARDEFAIGMHDEGQAMFREKGWWIGFIGRLTGITNDSLYLAYSGLVNFTRGMSEFAGGNKRKVGEKLADWMGRVGRAGANVGEFVSSVLRGEAGSEMPDLSQRLQLDLSRAEE